MVICAVVGCSKRSDRDKDVSFYRIPTIRTGRCERELELSTKRRAGFLAAISRADLTGNSVDQARVCSRHFISGKPASLHEELHPDWLPTQNLGHSKVSKKRVAVCEERYERKRARASCSTNQESATHTSVLSEQKEPEGNSLSVVEIQTEETSDSISNLQNELNSAYATIRTLKIEIDRLKPFTKSSLQSKSNEFIQHYTGLPNFKVLKTIFDFLVGEQSHGGRKLTMFQEYMVALLKLRHNLSSQDLAYRFDVHASTISRILLKWLTLMDIRLRPLIMWPEMENLRKTTPECFRAEFGDKVAVIVDCFEVFIERPSNLLARSCTWSNYKHHNTIKFLIGITPQGVVSFISDAWGGRVSDKYLTEHCGMLNYILPGDIVLADRGFDISDSVGMQQAHLHIPAFTKGKTQLSALEVEQTHAIANVRIHVERVIGNVRQKFSILQGTLPIDMVTKRTGEDCPLIDRIARVCAALCNVCNSVVPFD